MEKTKDINPTPLSRKKAAQERKKEKKRELDRAYYCRTMKRKLLKLWNVGERKESCQKGQREQGPKQRKQSGKKR